MNRIYFVLSLFCIISAHVRLVFAVKEVGDICTRSNDGRNGSCKKATECPEATRYLQLTGLQPEKCNGDIVCCVPLSSKPSASSTKLTISKVTNEDEVDSSKSISERKCDEYSRQVKQTGNALLLVPEGQSLSFDATKCDYQSVELIVGGQKAKQGEFPHMALLGWSSNNGTKWLCGGTLISDEYILTAAHCTSVNKTAPDVIRLGEQNIKRDDDGANPIDISIAEVIRHPDYNWPAKYNDIGLIRLQNKAPLGKFIRPACLYVRDTFTVNYTVATGWGRIALEFDPSDDLLKVSLRIVDNTICRPLYAEQQDRKLRNGIVDTQMCAGDMKGKKDTCQGDSGSPIQISSSSNICIFHIIGITSFGQGCGNEKFPGVYTRVSKYVPWIESIVWQ